MSSPSTPTRGQNHEADPGSKMFTVVDVAGTDPAGEVGPGSGATEDRPAPTGDFPPTCVRCGGPVPEGARDRRECPTCGAPHHANCLEVFANCGSPECPGVHSAPPGIASKKLAKKVDKKKPGIGSRLSDLMIIIAVLGVMAAVAVPNFRAAGERANSRACYANQKTISGAVEMYNLDKGTKRTDFSVSFWNDLKASGYLRSSPDDPGQGSGSGNHYEYTDTGNGIRCKVHGPIQQ